MKETQETQDSLSCRIYGFMAESERKRDSTFSALKSQSIANQHLTQKFLVNENGACSCSPGCENMQAYLVVGSSGIFFPPSWLVGRWKQSEAAG